jgi:hypothetical protein
MISANSYMFRYRSAMLREFGTYHEMCIMICVLLYFN